jgi:hypothetical protein
VPLARSCRWLPSAAGLLVIGCYGVPGAPTPSEGPVSTSPAEVSIVSHNRSPDPVRVDAETPGTTQPLGVVGGNARRVFRLAWRRQSPLRLRLRVVPGRQQYTNYLTVAPGEAIELVIPPGLHGAFIRRRQEP